MPLYEYECTQCKRHTEKIQKFSDLEITVCPHCGGPLERVISAPAIAFKGGGWFKDGYGNAKPAKSTGESSGSGAPGSSSNDAPAAPAGDTKPAPSTTTPAPVVAPAAASTSTAEKK
jgi:putative FmdB family regulatory protein